MISAFKMRYELDKPFGISRMVRTHVDAIIVEINAEGFKGFGEATDNPYYGSTIELLLDQFNSLELEEVLAMQLKPRAFYDAAITKKSIHPFLKNAIDQAYWDWYGRKNEKKISELIAWKNTNSKFPISSFTIGLDSIPNMIDKINSKPWPLYKLKINGDEPINRITELRKHTDVPFYVDANGSLSPKQVNEINKMAQSLGIELLEQPFDQDNEINFNKETISLPLAADESLRSSEDLERLRDYYDVVSFKLMKNAGISPTIDLIEKARNLGYKIMMGCMTESSVGISFISHFLPILDYVDMDGALLLKEDIASGLEFENGVCQDLKEFGSGITINRNVFERLRR